MVFNKCKRCGCFYSSGDSVCPKCTPKDLLEMQKLENFLAENTDTSLSEISIETGISAKNLNRYLENDKFSKALGKQSNTSTGNISINL